MNGDNAFNLAKLILIGMAVQLIVITYVFWTDYEGRKDVVAAARAGCERDKRDRAANAEGWRIAEDARRAEGEFEVAARYRSLAVEIEETASINCNERYPKASLLP